MYCFPEAPGVNWRHSYRRAGPQFNLYRRSPERRQQMRRLLVRAIVVGSFLCTAAIPLLAQQGTSEIGGKVTDEQGAVLPGVSVVVTNEESGVFREVTTGSDGSYFASQLLPGRYKIAAKLTSFRNFERG